MNYYRLAWIILIIQAEWLNHVRSMTKADIDACDFPHWMTVYGQLDDARRACLNQQLLIEQAPDLIDL